MPLWGYGLMIVAGLALIPVVALAGRGAGKKMRGNIALAGILLGLGEPVDPASKHLAEASHKDEEAGEAAGDPPS
jgi:hypothetical protein